MTHDIRPHCLQLSDVAYLFKSLHFLCLEETAAVIGEILKRWTITNYLLWWGVTNLEQLKSRPTCKYTAQRRKLPISLHPVFQNQRWQDNTVSNKYCDVKHYRSECTTAETVCLWVSADDVSGIGCCGCTARFVIIVCWCCGIGLCWATWFGCSTGKPLAVDPSGLLTKNIEI
jgi:hypothetical protein